MALTVQTETVFRARPLDFHRLRGPQHDEERDMQCVGRARSERDIESTHRLIAHASVLLFTRGSGQMSPLEAGATHSLTIEASFASVEEG
jgi:hypothetical protein